LLLYNLQRRRRKEGDFMPERAFISVIVPVFNEEKYIRECLNSMLMQDYPIDRMEWFFVDGMSSDRTLQILEEYQRINPGLIRVLHNPNKTVPYAMNLAIKQASGIYIIRLDAHAEYATNYFSKCVELLERTGADNVGGVMETKSRTPIGATIAKMLSSRFGVGDSQFRTNGKNGYVDTVPFGAFRREVFEKYGLYDERLTRNQDSELNYRIIHGGGKIFLSNEIKLAYYCRDSVSGIVKMAMTNGKWNIITSKLCPGSMRLRHFIPCIFVLSLIGMPLISLLIPAMWWLFCAEILAYVVLNVLFSARVAESTCEFFTLLYLFPLFHVSYGWGSIQGIFKVLCKTY